MPDETSDRIRSLREVAGVAKLAAQDLLTRRLVRKTQNGTVGRETVEPEDGEGVNIHLGDIVTPQQATPPAAGLGTLAKTAILAASLLGTGGLGAGLASMLLSPPPAAPVVQPVPPPQSDADTQYTLELVPPSPTPALP